MKIFLFIVFFIMILFFALLFIISNEDNSKVTDCNTRLVLCLKDCENNGWFKDNICIISCSFKNIGCLFSSLDAKK